MKKLAFVVVTLILTQTALSLRNPVPACAAPGATSKIAPRSKVTAKTNPRNTGKTKPKTAPKITPKPALKAPPQAPDPFAHLTPYKNGFGVMICEPVAAGVDEETAGWGAGATRWLDFVVGSQGELGRNPSLWDEVLVSQDLKRSDLRLSEADAAQIARILGLTHAVTSKIVGQGEQLALTLQLLKLERNKPALPLGDVISLNGTREAIIAALPDAARQISQRLGVKEPRVPAKLDLSPEELTLIGTVPLNSWEALDEARQTRLMKLAERETLAALLALRQKDIPKMARLIMHRAPDNIRALVVLARQGGNQMETFSEEWQPVLKQFPHNYQLKYMQLLQADWNNDRKLRRQAAENLVRAAPENPLVWYRLAKVVSDDADEVRKARVIGAMTETEMNTVMNQYPLWQAATERAVRLNPLDGDSWLALAHAATFNGDAIADKALWTAQKLMPDSMDVYGWGIQMYQPKWGGDPEQMLKLAAAMMGNEKLGPQLSRYIVTALNYVDLQDEESRKLIRDYLARRMSDGQLPAPLRAAWIETEKAPDDVKRWVKVSEEIQNAVYHILGIRLAEGLSKTEAARRASLFGLWSLCANYALYLAPKNSHSWVEYSRARVYSSQGSIDEHINLLEQAIELDPENTNAYEWGLLILQPYMGGDEELLLDLMQRAAAKPKVFSALATEIVGILNNVKNKSAAQIALWQKAQAQIDELEKTKSEDPAVQKTLGDYFYKTGQYPRALTASKNWVRLEPDNAEAHYNQANALRSMNENDAALIEYREALRIDKDHIGSLYYAAQILFSDQKKNYVEAEALYRRAIELYPLWISLHISRGQALNSMGKRAEAHEAWQKALNLADQYPSGEVELVKHLMRNNPAEP